jgi:hypothetical protein
MTRQSAILTLGLAMACEPSKYAGMGNACPSLSEAFAASDHCDEPAATVEAMCESSRESAISEGCQDNFDEYHHCIAAWAESGDKGLKLKCGERSWGMTTQSTSDNPWCQKEDGWEDFCFE